MKKLAIFASGSGSNAENIIRYFAPSEQIRVDSVFCNVPDAYVLARARKYDIPAFLFGRQELADPEKVLKQLQERGIDFIVLAGFLWLMPSCIVSAYPHRIVNIHPALLPAYGGKGMYGAKVHEAVIAAGEQESGITVHYIDEEYDRGSILFQARCPVDTGDDAESLARKVHTLEYEHFPRVIEAAVLQEQPVMG